MQLFINNWSTVLTAQSSAAATQLTVDPAEAAKLTGLGSGDYYLLTLAMLDGGGSETAWEVVKATGKASGVVTIERAQEGTTALIWEVGSGVSARATKGTFNTLRDAGGSAVSPGAATPSPLGTASAGSATPYSREDHVHAKPSPADIGAATSAQGAKADTAVQAAEKGAALGVATLVSDAKIPQEQLPAVAITSSFVVATQSSMLALTAETGDVAIRTDISTSFILGAEPASTLGNWQEILAPASGGGAAVGSATPQPLGTATPGVSAQASRQDHVHAIPDAAAIGADPTGTAAAAVAAHAGTGGATHAVAVASGAAGFMSGSDKAKLDGVAAGATANDSDANLKDRANHTGSQSIASVTGLQAALDAKAAAGIEQVSASANYTLVIGDANTHLLHPSADTTARTFTIPANGSVAFPIGTAITFVNQNAAGVITIAITTDTMRLAGAGTTGSRTLAANGMATALKITATEWIISGSGLT